MFKRAQRLSRDEFPAALKGGRRLTLPHLALVVSGEVPRYAVVVAKGVARLSVTRHRLKRQITALLRGQKLPPGLIVFARPGAPQLTTLELRAEIEAGLAKIA